ncbi:hypothetical protein [Lacticaseibacillus parakribbianus]|uniref:hypothetical protein n=1 Tax=Lacticaseibacillus parakribbianus TaxID=2970927 RepID=UPI0021CB2526|nr:hypothetical protein [Lacticaseibacillus parakribbianus]
MTAKQELARLDEELAQLTAALDAQHRDVAAGMTAYLAAAPTGDTLGLRHLLASLELRANQIDELNRTLAMKTRMRQLLRLEVK